jgi:uncharacterized protein (DUF1501 family)
MGAIAVAGAGFGIDDLLARARTDPLPPGAGVLVMLTLYGGNDGLNMVIPAADPAYQAARPQLAYSAAEVLPLGEGLGLNPGMPRLKKLWDAKKLAIVRGISYPKPDHSHFRSMDIWQSASPQDPISTGWLGRWLDGAGGRDPLHAVSLGPVLPPMLAGATTAGATLPLDRLRLPTGDLGTAFTGLGAPCAADSPEQATAAAAISDLHRVAAGLGPALDHPSPPPAEPYTPEPDPDPTPPGAGAGKNKGAGQLARELDVVAACIRIGAPTRVYSVSLGGFDTHTGERATQQRLLTELDSAVGAFLDDIAGTARGRDVVLVAYSEFGRRVAANANQGTDHGTAAPVLIAGQKIRGGFVGEQPSLTDLVDGDLKTTGDFRDIYTTLLTDVLGADPEPILGRGYHRLPLIHT